MMTASPTSLNRALKEWAVACAAMRRGQQTVLIRKGGIREEEGVFRVADSEFLLLPTYEHQDPAFLRAELRPLLEDLPAPDSRFIRIDSFARVESVAAIRREERLPALRPFHIWNEEYERVRLEFNPYDPLYAILLRVYALPDAVNLPMRPDYEGCRSWVTLERSVETTGARPVIPDEEFDRIRAQVTSAVS